MLFYVKLPEFCTDVESLESFTTVYEMSAVLMLVVIELYLLKMCLVGVEHLA